MTAALDDFSLLVDLKGPLDLQGRPAYHPSLDASDSKLAEVLAPYHFDEPYPCGLSSCRQPHQQGFLVVTNDGVETNVGKDCGKRIFGEDFVIKANLQKQRADMKYQLDTIQAVRGNKDTHLARISELYDRRTGTRWADALLRRLKESIGAQTASKLYTMAARGETSVEDVRDATKEERERHQAMNPDAKPLRYVPEKMGDLQGLSFLNDNPHQATTELKDKIYDLDRIDVKALSAQRRREWVTWANNIARSFDAIEESLADALRFFSADNRRLIDRLDEIETKNAR